MTIIFIIFGIIVYIIGIAASIDCDTVHNVKFHNGGFLGMGYTTEDHRKATSKDAWKSLIWPLLLFWYFLSGILCIFFTDIIYFPFLLIGKHEWYKGTKFYQFMNKLF